MGESGGLPSTGSHRVGHEWSDLAAAAAAAIQHMSKKKKKDSNSSVSDVSREIK